MLFPTHLLAGYVLGHVLFGERRLADLRHRPAWLGVLGAASPDLLDKPLATVGVTESFHSVGHSLLGLAVVGLVVAIRGRWVPVLAGWASHLAMDASHMVLNGRPADSLFLLWPVVDHTSQVTLPPGQFAVFYVGTPSSLVEVVLWLAVVVVIARQRRRAGQID